MSSSLIVGDLHLGKGVSIGRSRVGNVLNSRIIDQLDLLEWVSNQAIDNEVSSIILTGDICESYKPDYILIELFMGFLKKCTHHGIDIHIIAGNHDLQRTGTRQSSYLDVISSANLPRVYCYKNVTTINQDDISFTFIPFRDVKSMNCQNQEEALQRISEILTYEKATIVPPRHKVVVGHLAIEGSLYVGDEIDNEHREIMCPPSLFEGYDYVFMGHIHRPQELQEEDPYVGHVGSLDISDFGETDHDKIVVLFDPEINGHFREIRVPTRPLKHIQVDVPDQTDPTTYVLKKVQAVNTNSSLDKAIVKLEIKLLDEESEGCDRELLERKIYDLGVFNLLLTESKSVAPIPIASQALVQSNISPLSAIDIYSREKEEFSSQQEQKDFEEKAKELIRNHGS